MVTYTRTLCRTRISSAYSEEKAAQTALSIKQSIANFTKEMQKTNSSSITATLTKVSTLGLRLDADLDKTASLDQFVRLQVRHDVDRVKAAQLAAKEAELGP